VSEAPASPCVRVCAVDPCTGLCRGCWRTLAEIAAWPTLDDDGRRGILAAVDARRTG